MYFKTTTIAIATEQAGRKCTSTTSCRNQGHGRSGLAHRVTHSMTWHSVTLRERQPRFRKLWKGCLIVETQFSVFSTRQQRLICRISRVISRHNFYRSLWVRHSFYFIYKYYIYKHMEHFSERFTWDVLRVYVIQWKEIMKRLFCWWGGTGLAFFVNEKVILHNDAFRESAMIFPKYRLPSSIFALTGRARQVSVLLHF